VKCATFVSEIFTRYGSNKTNVWQEILTSNTLAFSCEVVHENLWKSAYVYRSLRKNQWHPLYVHGDGAVFTC